MKSDRQHNRELLAQMDWLLRRVVVYPIGDSYAVRIRHGDPNGMELASTRQALQAAVAEKDEPRG